MQVGKRTQDCTFRNGLRKIIQSYLKVSDLKLCSKRGLAAKVVPISFYILH